MLDECSEADEADDMEEDEEELEEEEDMDVAAPAKKAGKGRGYCTALRHLQKAEI